MKPRVESKSGQRCWRCSMAARPPSPSSSDDPPRPASTTSPCPSPSPSCSEPSSSTSGLSPPPSASRGRVSPDAGSVAAVSTLEGEVTPGEAEPDVVAGSLEARVGLASPGSPDPCSSEVSSSSPTGGTSPPWAPDSSQGSPPLQECRHAWPPPRPCPSAPSSSSWVTHAGEATVSRSTWRAASPVGASSSLSPESLWGEMEAGDVTSTGPPEPPEPARPCPADLPSTTSSWLPATHVNSTQEGGAWCPGVEGAWGHDPWLPPQPGPAEAGAAPPSWRSRAALNLTRVTPTAPPPRPPTPPRQSTPPSNRARAHSQPLRQSVSPPPRGYHRAPSPSGVRRSLSPPTHPRPHTPPRRSASPVPLPAAHVQPPSPGGRPRLSPRPRSARTPSPRPPRPPASAPDPSSASTSQQSPRPHYSKMRGR
ncbi:uncharacterized protein LOC126980720 isoform X2 [Eriocheir sinensis]|uniref:uncharacterized protein LOC126980720 isoform X2 n=1 Tax=Eriocheir sinensis TaxID=95602 RepID=UPI0021C8B5F2|nr:uncharacterized protein LOC126980720 isoform X2 [Eriocheir sinensis]